MAPETLAFEQFIDMFPKGLPVPEGGASTMMRSCERRNDFVPPRLTLKGGTPEGASVVLVSAAGAVGKSAVAKAAAAAKRAAYWDLSSTQVGSQSFVGTLATAYGSQFAAVQDDLNSGRAFVVMDALDETEVRSGAANFESFLNDLSNSLTDRRAHPAVLVLGRIETIELVSMAFEINHVPFAHYGIDFFDKDQAYTFVDRALDRRHWEEGARAPHRRHPQPYSKARDRVFKLLQGALRADPNQPWKTAEIRSFLGYAPVLESLADYLDTPDWQELDSDISTLGGELGSLDNAGPGQVLLKVIRQILERERKKLVRQVGQPVTQQLQPGQQLPVVYDEDEQLARLVGATLGVEVDAKVELQGNALQCYEKHLESWVPQHPFRRGENFSSVVFKEYSVAWALTETDAETRASITRALATKTYRPTHLLAQFFFSRSEGAQLDGQSFGLVYESVREPGPERRPFLVISPARDGKAIAEFLPAAKNKGSSVQTVELDPRTPITFWYQIGEAMILAPGAIQFGWQGVGFSLGPATGIFAQHLSFRCSALQVFCPDLDRHVLLVGRDATESAPDLSLLVRGKTDAFGVVWPNVGHPWAPYRSKVPAVKKGTKEQWDVFRKLLLMFFRQKTRRIDTVVGSRWAPGEEAQRDRLLKIAECRGVLTKDGEYYIFDSAYRPLMEMLQGKVLTDKRSAEFVSEFFAE